MSLETVSGVPECIEATPGATIDARMRVLPHYNWDHRIDNARWGPADTVYLEKTRTQTLNPFSFFSPQTVGYVHFPLGLDVASAAAVSAYLYALTTSLEPAPWLASTVFRAKRGVFACWCALSRVDLRVEMELPGKVRAYVVVPASMAADGKERQLDGVPDDELWWEAQLCSAVRAQVCVPTAQPGVRLVAVRRVDWLALAKRFVGKHPFVAEVVRRVLLHECRFEDVATLDQWSAPGLYRMPSSSSFTISNGSGGVNGKRRRGSSVHRNPVSQLQPQPGDLVVDSTTNINTNMNTSGNDSGNSDSSNSSKKEPPAVQSFPASPIAWLQLAFEHLDRQAYASCLIALNCIPVDSPEEEGLDPEFELPPNAHLGGTAAVTYAGRTKPGTGPSPVPAWYYEDILQRREDAAAMRGEVYVPEDEAEEKSGAGDAAEQTAVVDTRLRMLPGRCLWRGTILRAAYDVLVGLHNDLGWEELLVLRESVFYTLAEEHQEVEQEGEETENPDNSESRVQHEEQTNEAQKAKEKEEDEVIVVGEGEEVVKGPTLTRIAVKRLCVAWLDGLFQTLYADLVGLLEWQREEESVASKHAYAEIYNHLPPRAPIEWYLRGQLADRLQRPADAEMAYRMAVFRGWHLRSFLALMHMYADAGIVKEGVVVIDQLLKYYGEEDEDSCSPRLKRAVYRLIAAHGIVGVEAALKQEVNTPHPLWDRLLIAAVRNHVAGYDKR